MQGNRRRGETGWVLGCRVASVRLVTGNTLEYMDEAAKLPSGHRMSEPARLCSAHGCLYVIW